MNNDIVVEMKTDKANEEAGLLNKRPSTEQVRPIDTGIKGLQVKDRHRAKYQLTKRDSLCMTYSAPVSYEKDLISSRVYDVLLASAFMNVTHDATD